MIVFYNVCSLPAPSPPRTLLLSPSLTPPHLFSGSHYVPRLPLSFGAQASLLLQSAKEVGLLHATIPRIRRFNMRSSLRSCKAVDEPHVADHEWKPAVDTISGPTVMAG